MIARLAFLVAALVLTGWLYWLTIQLAHALGRLEQLTADEPRPAGRHAHRYRPDPDPAPCPDGDHEWLWNTADEAWVCSRCPATADGVLQSDAGAGPVTVPPVVS